LACHRTSDVIHRQTRNTINRVSSLPSRRLGIVVPHHYQTDNSYYRHEDLHRAQLLEKRVNTYGMQYQDQSSKQVYGSGSTRRTISMCAVSLSLQVSMLADRAIFSTRSAAGAGSVISHGTSKLRYH